MKKILSFLFLAWALLVIPYHVRASVCWKDNKAYYKSYEDCINAIDRMYGAYNDQKPVPAWCSGCNSAWSDAKYQECENNAIESWKKGCEAEWLITTPECSENEKLNKAEDACICANHTCCKAKFGIAIYDGNDTDGCGCANQAIFDGSQCVCKEGYYHDTKYGYCRPEEENDAKTDAECQQLYGLAHSDANTPTGCHCDENTRTKVQASGGYKCEWTQEYLNAQCKEKHDISIWNPEKNSCECMEYTELKNGKCEAESDEIMTARQELQYAVYRRILELAKDNIPKAQEAANSLFGINNEDALANYSEVNGGTIPYFEKLSFYQNMSQWPNLDTQEVITKAVGILKGKKATIGKMNLVIEDNGTVYTGVINTIGFLSSGTVGVYDTGSSKTTIITPNSIISPKGTIFEVSHNLENNQTITTVEEGSVEVVEASSKTISHVQAGEDHTVSSSYTPQSTTSDTDTDDSESILDTIGYTGSTAEESCFTDSSGSPYETAICYVKDLGVVQGYKDGSYKPNSPITRAEFTKIIMASSYENNEISGEKCFSDVQTDWYAPYVCKAQNLGFIGGYADKTFKPQNNIKLSEALKIILEAAAQTAGIDIPDAEGPWYQKYVNLANQLNLISTINQDLSHNLTRGEMAEIIYKAEQN